MFSIGIDFDNTILSYDELFYKEALKAKLIAVNVPKNKTAVRDAIRKLPQGNDLWTRLQAEVYGNKMLTGATLAAGVEDFFAWSFIQGITIHIISHKTQFPALGPKYDLRQTALRWLSDAGFFKIDAQKFRASHVHFADTLEQKFDLIRKYRCAYFVDDLHELLTHQDFPVAVKKIWYLPQKTAKILKKKSNTTDLIIMRCWQDIQKYFTKVI